MQKNNELRIRNNKDNLIDQIIQATTEKDKKALARRIAIASNTMKWSEQDLHALYQKRHEVRNFTAFVKWSCRIKG